VDARVLVPVKAFAAAKARLAPALDGPARAALARSMATDVVRAAAPLPVAVACDDDEVARWALEVGATVLWTPGLGLNGDVQLGFATLLAEGADLVIVAHGDLPQARDLARFDDGFGSFARHRAEADRLGVELRVVRAPELQWDVDTPRDLITPRP
jgi:2-phospho-L-lactate/phosphoenolpyruvate guanylyltransferase